MSECLSFEQFAKRHGLTTDHDVLSHIHAGLRSAPTTKTYKRRFDATLTDLQRKRDEAKEAYRRALMTGDVVSPLRPTIYEIAEGHPDLEATKAARRLIAKRAPVIDLPEWPKHPGECKPYSLNGSPIKVDHE